MVKVSTPIIPTKKIYVICPKKFTNDVMIGINTLRGYNEEDILYKIHEKKNTDLVVTLREKGLIGFLKSLFQKNKLKETISHKEFEHGLGDEFCSAFARLYSDLQTDKIISSLKD